MLVSQTTEYAHSLELGRFFPPQLRFLAFQFSKRQEKSIEYLVGQREIKNKTRSHLALHIAALFL